MKTMILALTLLFTTAASANSNVQIAKDIAAILSNKTIKTILKSEDVGNLKSIEQTSQLRCMGGPRMYELSFSDHSGPAPQKVLQHVMVGNCRDPKSIKVTVGSSEVLAN